MARPIRNEKRSVRLFAILVGFLPLDFRTRHGNQMIQSFQDCCRDLAPHSSCLDLAGFWIRTLADLAVTAAILHSKRLMMPKTNESAHFALLVRPWALLQRTSSVRRWLARFSPYPKPFRTALQFAWYEAKAYSSPQIHPEHLLLGLLRATKSVRRHVAPSAIDSAIAVIDLHAGHGRCLGNIPPSADPVVDDLSQKLIACALELAALRRQRLSALHLLLALREERNDLVSECLDSMGLDQLWLESELRAG